MTIWTEDRIKGELEVCNNATKGVLTYRNGLVRDVAGNLIASMSECGTQCLAHPKEGYRSLYSTDEKGACQCYYIEKEKQGNE